MAARMRPDGNDTPFFAAGIDPSQTAMDGFTLDPEDVHGAKGTGPTGEDETDDPEGMSEEDYENAISEAINAAEWYIDNEISPDRELAARYYAAEPFGNEEKGRSAAVSPEVRGAILGHMPGLMRMFCGTERYVEFKENPGTPKDQADAQTEIVQHVIMEDNDGYSQIQSAVDDALRRKSGILTWWWEEREEVTRTGFSGLNEDAFAMLQMEAHDKSDADENIGYDVQVTDKIEDETQDGGTLVPPAFSQVTPENEQALAMAGQAPPVLYVYTGVLNRRVIRKRAKFRAVPPEEFIITPVNSAKLDKYQLIGTRQEMTIGEIVAIGHDEQEVRDAIGAPSEGGHNNQTSLALNTERMQRDNEVAMERIFDTGFADVDPASEKVKYCEVYVLIDYDGDGIPERRKIVTVGDNNKIIYDEIWEDDTVPFAVGCPYPEPHAPFGTSVADLVMDIQEIKSEILRGTLDSLAESIGSRLAFWQGKVNVDDILSTRRNAAIRTNDTPSNVIQNFAGQFVGANSLPLIAYIDEDRNKRTGTNPASPTGFDPDATQSTAREAIGSMIDASQERTEYIARNIAESMMKRLFKGVRNLLLRNQDHRRTIRINGEDVTFDPRSWLSDLDVRVLVGTGRTNATKKAMTLEKVIDRQQAIYEKYGPDNGVVTLQHISNATQDYLRAMGFSDPTRYMGKVTPELEKGLKDMAAKKAQQPTPEQMLAQVQTDKNQKEFQAKMAKIAADMRRAVMSDDQKRDQAEMNFARDAAKIMGEYGFKMDEMAMRQAISDNDAAQGMAETAMASAQPPDPAAPTGGAPNG